MSSNATALEECWNCGSTEFTNGTASRHVKKQVICSKCYQPQEEDDYLEDDDWF